ncbi:MAG: CoB--CoM heterodisulfide reductase iron-sulfur subunit A family protein [Desulfobacterales bacterium]|nr:CoB--CoM heterodisulfide reductase iron-sulfur subunit A family protein [Desulfobacterales bacterium]
MKGVIIEKELTRVVIASCSPRTHEPLFRETCREAGINPYLFEMANIRDQCTWVHRHEPDKATAKCKDLVHMAVARSAKLSPRYGISRPIHQQGLVVGGGVAGMTAAIGLAEQGFRTHIVERGKNLGGHALSLHSTWKGESIEPYIEDLIKKVSEHPMIGLHLETRVKEVSGAVGGFVSTLVNTKGKKIKVKHGIAIIASGGKSCKPKEYLYGEDVNIFLSLELDQAVNKDPERLRNVSSAVFIQCAGSREPERPYCTRICCTHSIRSALTLKELNPEMHIYILYRDIRTYGQRENIDRKARTAGIRFIRYAADEKPRVEKRDGKLRVLVKDQTIGMALQINADIITLASAIVPDSANDALSSAFKIPMDEHGFFMEAHPKLRPVDFASEGLFVCGLAHGPKSIDETISQARATVSRACTILAHKERIAGEDVAVVDPNLCGACLTCVRTCPYGVPFINDHGTAQIDAERCHGCGICASECPYQAITLTSLTTGQVMAKIDACLA